MGEYDLDAIVLETVRRHTGNAETAPKSRLEADLGLSENGRRSLFSFVVEAFTARGLNLPARGFYQSSFLRCTTVAEIQTAIRETLTGTRSGAKREATAAPTPAPAATPASQKAKPAKIKSAAKKPAARKKSAKAKSRRAA